ncbi:laccase-14 [Hevea brasiliensis]|uniref:laccase-14 n=1 Tax=Hevea brasiliensis TaxID=3981 RepID=UPI0025D28336|nr:laccase-14 [Hevea brasiliensis]
MVPLKVNFVLGLLGVAFLNILVLCMARPGVHYYDFVLKETNFTRLCSTKSMLTVNGSFPGPVIQVRRGDLVYVNVHNQGKYGVTIHWHGVKQPRNPWSDGPENITQCPIQPGTSFTYKVILSDEEGTLWWHAHSDWSRATVHGAFVILPKRGTTYPFAKPYKEQIIVLGSWFKEDLKAIIDEALETGGNPNTSNAHTINGYTGVVNATVCPTVIFYLPVAGKTFHMLFSYGKTYLLRIVNAVMNDEQFFGIANHKLTVVGSDGAYTKPFTTDYLFITPGQTMDVLVTANQSPSKYYMVSTPYFDSFAEFDNTSVKAIIEYEGKYSPPKSIPLPNLPAYNNESAAQNFTVLLRSLASKEHPVNVPKKITKRIFITISLNLLPCPAGKTCKGPFNQTMSASLNNIISLHLKLMYWEHITGIYFHYSPFIRAFNQYIQDNYIESVFFLNRGINGVFGKNFPNQPKIFDFTGDVTNISQYTTQGTKVIPIEYGEKVELVFQGTAIQSPENHPMHLHGFSFYLVGIGTGNFSKSDIKNYNLVDPPEVNTIGIPRKGWAAIRFTANNPGVWFMHCHLERHASWGMDTVIIVKEGRTRASRMLPPPAYMPPCTI